MSLRSLSEEYRRSLKIPAAEEILDLVFYRPLAFLFVKAVYRTPLTPNQTTIVAGALGVVAGFEFSRGAAAAASAGAVLYLLSNVLDCADGMLARLQNSGTPLGRIIDGVADYIASMAIFIGIGVGLDVAGSPVWVLVIAAGISSAVHATMFDSRQAEFMAAVRGERNFRELEIERFSAERNNLRFEHTRLVRRFILTLYLAYLRVQTGAQGSAAGNKFLIQLWSLLGPTTNRTVLIVCALIGRVDLFLWIVVVGGNGWLIFCLLVERIADAFGGARNARD